MQNNQKQYGLIKLSKGGGSVAAAASSRLVNKSVFGDSDDDSDSDSGSVPQFQTTANTRKQAKANISRAVELDPSIFQYDEVYEEMKTATPEAKQKKESVERKSRYIGKMIKKRDEREKEQELRAERKIQKEREMEGDEFNDKESFVTSAYKQKLEEMRKTQADIDRQESVENILDVTKQSDLNGFYRSLYKNSLFSTDPDTETPKEQNESVKFNKKSTNQKKTNLRERNITDENEDDEEREDEEDQESFPLSKTLMTEQKNKESLPEQETPQDMPSGMAQKRSANETEKLEENSVPKDAQTQSNTNTSAEGATEAEPEAIPQKKPKVDRVELIKRMFTKRTVGQAFEDARKRYLERKAIQGV